MLLSIILIFEWLESNIIASEKFFGGLKSAECLPECSMIISAIQRSIREIVLIFID